WLANAICFHCRPSPLRAQWAARASGGSGGREREAPKDGESYRCQGRRSSSPEGNSPPAAVVRAKATVVVVSVTFTKAVAPVVCYHLNGRRCTERPFVESPRGFPARKRVPAAAVVCRGGAEGGGRCRRSAQRRRGLARRWEPNGRARVRCRSAPAAARASTGQSAPSSGRSTGARPRDCASSTASSSLHQQQQGSSNSSSSSSSKARECRSASLQSMGDC
ncbi:Protein of unknown function, partial [Gryllus bimaculatus]